MHLDSITEAAADAVVMAARADRHAALLVGSVAESVIAASDVPVFVIRARPGECPTTVRADHARVLVPLDGSSFAESALSAAAGRLWWRVLLVWWSRRPRGARRVGVIRVYLDQREEHSPGKPCYLDQSPPSSWTSIRGCG